MWLNKRKIEEGLDHKNVLEITIAYHLGHRKHKYKLVEEPKKQVNIIFIDKKLAMKMIMNCRTTSLIHLEQAYDLNNMMSF